LTHANLIKGFAMH